MILRDFHFPIIDFQFPIIDFQFPIIEFQFPIIDFQFPIIDFHFPISILPRGKLSATGFGEVEVWLDDARGDPFIVLRMDGVVRLRRDYHFLLSNNKQ